MLPLGRRLWITSSDMPIVLNLWYTHIYIYKTSRRTYFSFLPFPYNLQSLVDFSCFHLFPFAVQHVAMWWQQPWRRRPGRFPWPRHCWGSFWGWVAQPLRWRPSAARPSWSCGRCAGKGGEGRWKNDLNMEKKDIGYITVYIMVYMV